MRTTYCFLREGGINLTTSYLLLLTYHLLLTTYCFLREGGINLQRRFEGKQGRLQSVELVQAHSFSLIKYKV